MKNKTTIALTIILLALPLVAADHYELYCLGDGDSIDFRALCNPAMPIQYGPAHICVHHLDNGKTCNALLNVCNSLSLTCSGGSGGGTIDTTPPSLTIHSPIQNEIYTSRAILLSLSTNEKVSIDYQDKNDPRRWKQVCSSCSSYSQERSFNEGLNDITIRAKDQSGNIAYFDVSFSVDSKDPKIKSVSPTSGFTSGDFEIEFEEDNPKSLSIIYGNYETGTRTHNLNIATECFLDDTYECSTQIDLEDYEGQQIEYIVNLEDVAGNSAQTSTNFLEVDHSNPLINSIDYTKNGRNVYFVIEVADPFISEISYIDLSDRNPREKKLCSRITNNKCEKKVSFKDGEHEVEIIARDEANNEAKETINFLVDSKSPKISNIEPSGKFASGLFEIEFQESAPTEVSLTYGNLWTGTQTKILNLQTECSHFDEEYSCSTEVSLDNYNGEEIDYTFTVKDQAENTVTKSETNLAVDTTFPEIKSIETQINGKSVYFTIEIDESNLDQVTYIDNSDPRAREKRLCSRLSDGKCEKKVSFSNDGDHDVTITVYDEAGRSTAQSTQFFTDSKKPKIKSIWPTKNYASGFFELIFEETNPETIELTYGNYATGKITKTINKNSCVQHDNKFTCSELLDLGDYEGQQIDYTFAITDKAGQTAEKGATQLKVDTTFPIINDITYEVDETRAEVTLSLTEENLDEVTYINHFDRNPRERKFCSRLSSGKCTKRIILNEGKNRIQFTISDEAGNSLAETIDIDLDA